MLTAVGAATIAAVVSVLALLTVWRAFRERFDDVLQALGTVRSNDFALRFFLEPYEITIFPDGRAIIKGTQDVGVARSLYARYIGN